jgi:soluble lytic murein transglycosylase-like protein
MLLITLPQLAHAQAFTSAQDGESESVVLSNIADAVSSRPPSEAVGVPGFIAVLAGNDLRTDAKASQAVQPVHAIDLRRLILQVALETGVGAELIAAVAAAESRFDPTARSPKGALGLMQLMPATAARFGVRDVWAVEDNLRGGAAYLRWLLDLFGGDVRLTVAAYNAGEQAVLKAGRRIPAFSETRNYVPRVLAWRDIYAAEFKVPSPARPSIGAATPQPVAPNGTAASRRQAQDSASPQSRLGLAGR